MKAPVASIVLLAFALIARLCAVPGAGANEAVSGGSEGSKASKQSKVDAAAERISQYEPAIAALTDAITSLNKQTKALIKSIEIDHKLVDGHCILDCHKECIDCNLAKDDTSCFQCRNVRLELKNSIGGNKSRTVQCLPECPVGYQLSGMVDKLCIPCIPGHFKNSTGNQNCLQCPPGTFSAVGAAAACKPCSPGTFTSTQGQKSCSACPPGTSSTEGSVSCANNCKRGEFSPSKGTACRKCPAGSFTPSAGSKNCTLCPEGSFANRAGSPECSLCPAGTSTSSRTGATKCQNCDLNFALSRHSGMAHCDKCPDSGATFGTSKCYRRVEMNCTLSFPDCERTIDRDIHTDGTTINKAHTTVSDDFTHFRYTFKQTIHRVKGFIVWPKKNYKASVMKNLRLTLYGATNKKCFVDSGDVYPYSMNLCSGRNVTSMKINHRSAAYEKREVTLAEIAVYGE